MSSSSVEKPLQFFKVIVAATLEAKKLRIPDAFVQHWNGFPKKVVLANRIGRLWHVKMVYSHEGLFFVNGWQQFVEDNLVEEADILVFKYDGDRQFNVKIFGKSACEKRETIAHVGTDPKVNVKMGEEKEEICKKKVEDDIISVDVGDDHSDHESTGEDSNDSLYDEQAEEEEEDKKEGEPVAKTNFMCRIRGKTLGRAAKRAASEIVNDILPSLEVRKYVKDQNPYFVAKLSYCQLQDLLFVPSCVLKDFRLELAQDITFHDELEGRWPGKVVRWKDG